MKSTMDTPPPPVADAKPHLCGGPAGSEGPSHLAMLPDDGQWSKLLTAFERLFSIGILYPAGHAQCVNVATAFQSEVRSSLAGSDMLAIEACREALAIQGCLFTPGIRSGRRIHEVMTALGISRLEIDKTATPADLYAVVSLLLQLKHEAETTRGLRHLEFKGLPPTVRLTLKRFSQRTEGVSDGPSAVDEESNAALELRGFGEETREAMADLVQKISLQLVHQQPVQVPDARIATPAAEPTAPTATGPAPFPPPAAAPFPPPVAPPFPPPATAPAPSGPPLAASRDSGPRVHKEIPSGLDAAGIAQGCCLTLTELQRRLVATADTCLQLNLTDRAEQLGVLMQMLVRAAPSALAGITDLLGKCLADPLRARERSVLTGALRQMIGTGDEEILDRALPILFAQLRKTGVLGPLFLEVLGSVEVSARRATWPHLLNELLLGFEGVDDDAFHQIALLATGLPEEEMRLALPRLAKLEAIRDHRLAQRLFQTSLREFAGLFSVLLGSSAVERVGPWLMELLRAQPPNWPGSPVLILMGDYAPGHRGFLARLLRETARGEYSVELLQSAIQTIVRGLKTLPRKQRGAPWVPRAVETLGALPHPAAAELLSEIRGRRRLVVLRAWPAPCREAATRAQRARADAGRTSPS
jgi:hypothetical protein